MIFFLLFQTMFAFAFDAKELKCQSDGKIKFRYAGREVEESASYCYDASRSTLSSKSCVDSKKCGAWQAKVCEVGKGIFHGSFGSPGFKLCQAVKGSPQLIEFHDGNRWWTMDRCYFESDKSFVDTGILLEKRHSCP